jgi:hypothetical protein
MLGPRAHAAVPFLIDALNGEDEFTIIAAAVALWHVDRRIDVALPHLARLFPDFGETVCDAITEIGPAAAPLIDQFLQRWNPTIGTCNGQPPTHWASWAPAILLPLQR